MLMKLLQNDSINVGFNKVITAGYSHSWGDTTSFGSTETDAKGKNYNLATGVNENATYTYKSYAVSSLLEKLQFQLKRMDNGRAIGMWKCASYVIAESAQVSLDVCNFLQSLTQGDQSFVEVSAINHWEQASEDAENEAFNNIKKYICHFTHPVFANKNDLKVNQDKYEHEKVLMVTPTAIISTTDLAYNMSFPRKSVAGLPALECARFGRNVMYYKQKERKKLPIGKIFHMYNEEKSVVELEMKMLTSIRLFQVPLVLENPTQFTHYLMKHVSNLQRRLNFL